MFRASSSPCFAGTFSYLEKANMRAALSADRADIAINLTYCAKYTSDLLAK